MHSNVFDRLIALLREKERVCVWGWVGDVPIHCVGQHGIAMEISLTFLHLHLDSKPPRQ
jgi:hypothetical protein